jgi:hypothetical protein
MNQFETRLKSLTKMMKQMKDNHQEAKKVTECKEMEKSEYEIMSDGQHMT